MKKIKNELSETKDQLRAEVAKAQKNLIFWFSRARANFDLVVETPRISFTSSDAEEFYELLKQDKVNFRKNLLRIVTQVVSSKEFEKLQSQVFQEIAPRFRINTLDEMQYYIFNLANDDELKGLFNVIFIDRKSLRVLDKEEAYYSSSSCDKAYQRLLDTNIIRPKVFSIKDKRCVLTLTDFIAKEISYNFNILGESINNNKSIKKNKINETVDLALQMKNLIEQIVDQFRNQTAYQVRFFVSVFTDKEKSKQLIRALNEMINAIEMVEMLAC